MPRRVDGVGVPHIKRVLCQVLAVLAVQVHGPQLRSLPVSAAGLLAARSATQITGKPESGQGMKLERLLTSGIAGPVSEATAMFYQVRALL